MKKLIFLLLLTPASIQAGDFAIHMNLGAKHFKSEVKGVKLNDETPGFGVNYRTDRGYLTGGYMPENSFGNESWYGGVGLEPFTSRNFGFGFQWVMASGYEDTPARNGGFVGSAVFRIGPKENSLKLHLIGFSSIGLQYQIDI